MNHQDFTDEHETEISSDCPSLSYESFDDTLEFPQITLPLTPSTDEHLDFHAYTEYFAQDTRTLKQQDVHDLTTHWTIKESSTLATTITTYVDVREVPKLRNRVGPRTQQHKQQSPKHCRQSRVIPGIINRFLTNLAHSNQNSSNIHPFEMELTLGKTYSAFLQRFSKKTIQNRMSCLAGAFIFHMLLLVFCIGTALWNIWFMESFFRLLSPSNYMKHVFDSLTIIIFLSADFFGSQGSIPLFRLQENVDHWARHSPLMGILDATIVHVLQR